MQKFSFTNLYHLFLHYLCKCFDQILHLYFLFCKFLKYPNYHMNQLLLTILKLWSLFSSLFANRTTICFCYFNYRHFCQFNELLTVTFTVDPNPEIFNGPSYLSTFLLLVKQAGWSSFENEGNGVFNLNRATSLITPDDVSSKSGCTKASSISTY